MRAAWIYLFLCTVIWGWTFVATKICLQYVTPVELIGLRFVIGLPVLWLVVRAKRLKVSFSRKERRSVLLGAAVLTAHFLVQVNGLKYTSATNTGWLMAVIPLVMALLAFLILRERLSRAAWLGIGVATSGVLVLVSGGRLASFDWLKSIGDWLVLASAHTWALYTIAVRDVTRARNPLAVTLAVMMPAAVLILALMLPTADWRNILGMPLDGIVAMLFLGILGHAVGHWFWQEGVARVGAARAGVFLYLEPLATTSLAVPLLGEAFGLATALGGLLVLAGVYLAGRPRRIPPG
jgi:drug/metabolite transporter (DMT)-like permease